MSSRFERVSRVEIEPNKLHAYTKNIGTLNRLSMEFLKNFGRVSLVFPRAGNLQHIENTSKRYPYHSRLPPSFLHTNIQHKYIYPCSTSLQHSPMDHQQDIQSKENNIDTQFKERTT